jgi:hypothetical protein
VSGLRIAPIKALPPPNNPTGGLAGAQLLREKPASQKRYYPQCFQRLNYFHQNGAAFTLYDTERRPLLDGKRKIFLDPANHLSKHASSLFGRNSLPFGYGGSGLAKNSLALA